MKLIAHSRPFPQLQNHALGVFQREHEHTPFIVCGINEKQEPLLECGYAPFATIDNPAIVLQKAINATFLCMQRATGQY